MAIDVNIVLFMLTQSYFGPQWLLRFQRRLDNVGAISYSLGLAGIEWTLILTFTI